MSNVHLIILPGWEQNRSHWTSALEKLATLTEVSLIELPGFGLEPLVSDTWGVPEYTHWVYQQISQLTVAQATEPRIVLLGHSFGGRIAHYLACNYQPKWLKGLILYAAPVLYRPSWLTRLKLFLARLVNFLGLTKIFPSWLKQFFYSDDLQRSRLSGKEKILRQVIGFDQTALLAQNNYCTVLLWGQQDDVVPVNIAQELANKLANSRLIVVPDQGHNFHLTNPNLFYGTLKQILDLYF